MSEMLELALGYAAAGIHVFPCREKEETFLRHDGTKGIKLEKTPIPSAGFEAATTRERLVLRWWDDAPGALIGAATGPLSGFWVLDIDVPSDAHKKDGRLWLDEMTAKHGPLPKTKIGMTANGGYHFFFRHEDGIRNAADVGPGVDVRGDGGFVIMPGSIMADGRFYEWQDDSADIAVAPEWLIEAVKSKAAQWEGDAYSVPANYTPGKNKPYVDTAVDAEVRKLENMGEGGRGAALNSSAFSLGTLVGSGDLSAEEATSALFNAAVANGLVKTDGPHEVMSKIRRGLEAGSRRPRAAPEAKQKSRDNTSLRDIDRMVERAKARAAEKAEEETRRAEYAEEYHDDDDDGARYEEDYHDEEYPEDDDEEEVPAIRATPFKWIEPHLLPTRQFLFGKHYTRQYVSVTVSPGGLGKTSNASAEMLSMATGRDFLGVEVREPLNVWFFNAEDPMDELQKRLTATMLYYRIQPEEVEGRLFLDSGRDQELIIAREDRDGLKIVEPVFESIVDQILLRKIDVVIVDPFVSTHSVNENDNGSIDRVAKLWAKIAHVTNCAIDIVHHLKKVDGREATVEDARGAVSLIGAARSVRVFNRMNEEQAAKAGLDDMDQRHGYFNVTNGKNNLAPVSSKLEWRRLVGQGLDNGNRRDPEDSMPVVIPYKFPSLMDAALILTYEELSVLRAEMGKNGDWLPAAKGRGKDDKSLPGALEFVLKLSPGEDDNTVAATIYRLETDGVIEKFRHQDEMSGKVTKAWRLVKNS